MLTVLEWFGYVGVLVSWSWLAICYGKDIMTSDFVKYFMNPEQAEPTRPLFELPSFALPQIVINILAVILAVLAVVFVVTTIAKAPGGTRKISEEIAQASASSLTPIIAKRFHPTRREKLIVHESIVFSLRLLICWLPLILMAIFGQRSSFVIIEIMAIGALLPALWASLFFTISLFVELYHKKKS